MILTIVQRTSFSILHNKTHLWGEGDKNRHILNAETENSFCKLKKKFFESNCKASTPKLMENMSVSLKCMCLHVREISCTLSSHCKLENKRMTDLLLKDLKSKYCLPMVLYFLPLVAYKELVNTMSNNFTSTKKEKGCSIILRN